MVTLSKNSNKIQKNGWNPIRRPALKPISREKSMTKIHDRIRHKCCSYLISQYFFFIAHQFVKLAVINVRPKVATPILPPAGFLSARQ